MTRRLAAALVVLAAAPALAEDLSSVPARAPDASPPVVVEHADGPLTVVTTVDPARPGLGTPIRLRMEARLAAEPTARVRWPELRQVLVDELGEAVAEVDSARVAADGRSVDAVLRLWDEGEHTLPALTVRALREAPGGGEPEELGVVIVEGLTLTVSADVAADADPAPPREGIAYVPPPAPFPWVPVIAGVVLLVLIALVVAWWRRRPRPELPAPSPPPAHELALAALRELSSRELPQHGQMEPYFVELSEILRRYLEDRFGLRAPEQTTEEFLADVSRTDAGRRAIETAHRDVLREFLTRADLVKFARDEPSVDEALVAGTTAERFVRDTAERPRPADDAAGEAARKSSDETAEAAREGAAS